MRLSRSVTLMVGLGTSVVLALPAAAAPSDRAPEGEEHGPGGPVAHCLALDDESEDADGDETEDSDGDETDGDESEDADGVEGDETDDTDTAQTEDTDGDESEDTDGTDGTDGTEDTDGEDSDDGEVDSEVAQCVLESLPDIVGSPHAASVVDVVAGGIAEGKTDGTYGTQDAVTRGQMATFLSRALELAPSEQAELPDDVDAAYVHADAIAAVVEDGIAEGKADGSYEPQEPVTRGQMATFLDRALDLALEAAGEQPEDAEGSVHEQAVEAVIAHGIALGFEDGDFRPSEAVTRGQMASFLDRALDL